MQYCTGSTSQNISTIQYKLGVTVHHCLQYKAPEYLVNFVHQSQTFLADIIYGQPLDII